MLMAVNNHEMSGLLAAWYHMEEGICRGQVVPCSCGKKAEAGERVYHDGACHMGLEGICFASEITGGIFDKHSWNSSTANVAVFVIDIISRIRVCRLSNAAVSCGIPENDISFAPTCLMKNLVLPSFHSPSQTQCLGNNGSATCSFQTSMSQLRQSEICRILRQGIYSSLRPTSLISLRKQS